MHPGEVIEFSREFDGSAATRNRACGNECGESRIRMGYFLETALQYCKKVSDHHKGWTMCRIARLSITRELMVPYVRLELGKAIPEAIPDFSSLS